MKRSLTILTCLLTSAMLFAQQRSESEALQVARKFLQKQGVSPHLVNAEVPTNSSQRKSGPAKQSTGNAYYIFNDENNHRFIIVSGDERLYNILGYSDCTLFDASTAAPALLELLEGYEEEYESIVESGWKAKRKSGKVEFEDIQPILKTKWGQRKPFNDRCPINLKESTNNRSLSGCVATAMAQVMKHHSYPTKGQGYYSYATDFGTTLSEDFSSFQFDWNNMINEYTHSYTDEQAQAVADLMYACGVSVSMKYGEGSSGAYSSNIPYALINYFGYNPNTVFRKRNYYQDEEWKDFIMSDLRANLPVFYRGDRGGNGGHQFIIDGCDSDGMYHFDFGWNGDYNGYYHLDLSDTYPYYFPNEQAMINQVAPNLYGNHEDVFYASTFISQKNSINIGETNTFNLFGGDCRSTETTYLETGTGFFNGEIGVAIYDENMNFVKPLCSKHVSDLSQGHIDAQSFSVAFDNANFRNGTTYYIAPYAKSDLSNSPTRIRTRHGAYDYYQVNVSNGTITFILLGKEENFVPEGTYLASAYNEKGEKVEWEVYIRKNEFSQLYEVHSLDPAVESLPGYHANKALGEFSEDFTIFSFRNNQNLGSGSTDIALNNYSGSGKITMKVNGTDKSMYIDDVWGCIKITKTDADPQSDQPSSKAEELSRYSNTVLKYKAASQTPEQKVEKPIVEINESNMVTIISKTEGASTYFTTDGSTPNSSASLYELPFLLDGNLTVKSVAVKDGKTSDVAVMEIKDLFVTSNPTISADNGIISMSCLDDAIIRYTTNGDDPTIESDIYDKRIECKENTIFKAIAFKENYLPSEIVSFFYEAPRPETPVSDNKNLVALNVTAGSLSKTIPIEEAKEAISLTVSGILNGTDIKHIREILQGGKLAYLNMEEATIVSGGDPYYHTSNKDYYTEDNVIGDYMFYEMRNLISIKLPKGTKAIGKFSFEWCKGLKEIILPDDCEDIRIFAFSRTGIERIFVSKNIKSFDYSSFCACYNLKEIEVASENPLFKSINGVLFSKDGTTLLLYPTGKDEAEYNIPDGTNIIGGWSFRYSSLKNINIPETVSEIRNSAFADCDNLQEIVIPNSVQAIGEIAFMGCDNLVSVEMSEHVKELNGHSFSFCPKLKSFHIAKSIETINPHAFTSCISLNNFIVDEQNEHFTAKDGVIYSKDMTTLVRCPSAYYTDDFIIPNSIVSIQANAFNHCSHVYHITLPQSLLNIGNYAFSYSAIRDINIPANVNIGNGAFSDCDSLKSFMLPEGKVNFPDFTLSGSDNIEYLYIPSTIKNIGAGILIGCSHLNVVNCNISNFEEVEFWVSSYGDNNRIEQFHYLPSDCTWRIPQGCSDHYKAQPWWVPTWKIIEDETRTGIDEKNSESFNITWYNGMLSIVPNIDSNIRIYSIDGTLRFEQKAERGNSYQVPLKSGMYLINNKKYSFQ